MELEFLVPNQSPSPYASEIWNQIDVGGMVSLYVCVRSRVYFGQSGLDHGHNFYSSGVRGLRADLQILRIFLSPLSSIPLHDNSPELTFTMHIGGIGKIQEEKNF